MFLSVSTFIKNAGLHDSKLFSVVAEQCLSHLFLCHLRADSLLR